MGNILFYNRCSNWQKSTCRLYFNQRSKMLNYTWPPWFPSIQMFGRSITLFGCINVANNCCCATTFALFLKGWTPSSINIILAHCLCTLQYIRRFSERYTWLGMSWIFIFSLDARNIDSREKVVTLSVENWI